ncbi:G-type lectin S-receptor-like serine/threonine-protein kinase [Dorcoceras hygrometricum]|uniref:G-type lectin S-receptor-like serine/threonine-protein kinase n=1 Tax=Dorcoceras hygrometricum TaxID=472368 RepID=A0A2Z7C4G5_9LAMI|nr:G-type lectin S-receptor-like serine/threonine-protein kinase [Dorcoceras hygrometricum]
MREQIRVFRIDAGSDAMSFALSEIRVNVNRSECWDLFSQCDVVFLVLAGNPDATPYCLVARLL